MVSNTLTTELDGWLVNQVFAGRPARIRHDVEPRTESEDSSLSMTNEMFPYRPVKDGEVDSRSKITFKLARKQAWVDSFRESLGKKVFGQFATPGFGWMDTNHDTEEYKFSLIQCGGNLVNVVAVEGEWALVETQAFERGPDPILTYKKAPHLNIKQVLVGSSAQQKIFWICDKKRGDVIFPAVSPVQAAIPVNQLEFFPSLPFETRLSGKPVVIEAYRFTSSDTYAQVGGDWFLIEEMPVTGDGSHLDRKVNVEGWLKTCPPPIIGWTKGKNADED